MYGKMFRSSLTLIKSICSPSISSMIHMKSFSRLQNHSPGIKTNISLPPPAWSTLSHISLPAVSSSEKNAMLDKMPVREMFAPTSTTIADLSYDMPASSNSSGPMLCRLLRTNFFKPPRTWNMLRVKHHQMKLHQRKKWRRKYRVLIAKMELRKSVKKEKLFRAELLAQIKGAEQFDAEKYVNNMLETIDKMPREETIPERANRLRDLKLKYRTQTVLVPPKFDDPVN